MCSKDCLLIYMKPVRVIGQSEENRTEHVYLCIFTYAARKKNCE